MPHIHTGLHPRKQYSINYKVKTTESSHALAVQMQQNHTSSPQTNKEIIKQTTLNSRYKAPSVCMHGSLLSKSTKCAHRFEDKKETKFQYNFLKHHSNVTTSIGLRASKLMRWLKLTEVEVCKLWHVVKWCFIQFVSLGFAFIEFIQSAKGVSFCSLQLMRLVRYCFI